jgi:transcriptional regulator with XRE-family HTH domain
MMDDNEWLVSMSSNKPDWEYHEICLWLPHKPETVEDIANDMIANGFRQDRAIATYEGKILDGRHRYEAALKAGVEPIFAEFQGTKEEAIAYVTSENVARRHLNTKEKEFFYEKRTTYLGVQDRGGDRGNQYQSGNRSNDRLAPTQAQHAEAMGVGEATIRRWERDRKEIKADPELAAKAKTPEGYQEAKKEVQKRRKATKEEANKIAKLKSLGERSEAESSNVNKKLDKYREQGIDVDEVESQGDADRARDNYREQQRPITEMADEIAKILIDTKDYRFVATLARAAYSKQGELEHAYNLITAEGNYNV